METFRLSPYYLTDIRVPKRTISENQLPIEIARFEDGLTRTRHQLLAVKKQLQESFGGENARWDIDWMDCLLLLLEDRTLIEEVILKTKEGQYNIEYVFHQIVLRYLRIFETKSVKPEDIFGFQDVMTRVLQNILGDEITFQKSRIEQENLSRLIRDYLKKDPQEIYRLSPRKFEEVMSELLRDMGFETRLTPPSRDGRKDILAVMTTPLGKMIVLVECKRYRADHKVGIEPIRSFLFTVLHDKASCGLYATTSFYTAGAKQLASEYKWQLHLKDFYNLKDWINQYGNWTESSQAGLWLPKGARPAGLAPFDFSAVFPQDRKRI